VREKNHNWSQTGIYSVCDPSHQNIRPKTWCFVFKFY